jgi:hypothetical protein
MTAVRFEARGYLRFDLAAGRVASRDDRRHVVLPAEVLEAAGSRAELVEAARRWGTAEGQALAALGEGDVLSDPPERFLTDLAHLLATLGLGRCELESWGGVLFAIVDGAPGGGGAEAVLSGLLAGVFEAVAGAPFECVPMPEGRFLLLGREGVDKVRAWVAGGARAGEVASRMLAGEHLPASRRGA